MSQDETAAKAMELRIRKTSLLPALITDCSDRINWARRTITVNLYIGPKEECSTDPGTSPEIEFGLPSHRFVRIET